MKCAWTRYIPYSRKHQQHNNLEVMAAVVETAVPPANLLLSVSISNCKYPNNFPHQGSLTEALRSHEDANGPAISGVGGGTAALQTGIKHNNLVVPQILVYVIGENSNNIRGS